MSLRSIILKGRFYQPEKLSLENMSAFVDYLSAGLLDRQTKLINAQSIWNDVVMPPIERRDDDAWNRLLNFAGIPRPKPPFEKIWLETIIPAEDGIAQQRAGAMILRIEGWENIARGFASHIGPMPEEAVKQIEIDRPATFVNALVIHDYQGSATPSGNCIYWLDQDGKFLWSFRMSALALGKDDEDQIPYHMQMRMRQGWILHTFARMNCANAVLVPIPDGHEFKNRRHQDGPPSSVWHEIRVSAAPQIRHAAPAKGSATDECSVRFHWVRGHYADYTKGAGLFGNPQLRAVFWIPEHRAGNEGLGTVVSSYTVS